MNARMGRDFTLDDLRTEHDAVFLGIGTHKPAELKVPGADLPGVQVAIRFLADAARGEGLLSDSPPAPVASGGADRVEGLVSRRREFGPPAESGRRRPVPTPGP